MQIGSGNRQLLFLYEKGKKKLMDGARINFGGDSLDRHFGIKFFGIINFAA